MKKKVEVCKEIFRGYSAIRTDIFIEDLERVLAQIEDDEARANAVLEIQDTGTYEPSYNLCLIYSRNETDEEEIAREKREADYKKLRFELAKREYEAMKPLFEPEQNK